MMHHVCAKTIWKCGAHHLQSCCPIASCSGRMVHHFCRTCGCNLSCTGSVAVHPMHRMHSGVFRGTSCVPADADLHRLAIREGLTCPRAHAQLQLRTGWGGAAPPKQCRKGLTAVLTGLERMHPA